MKKLIIILVLLVYSAATIGATVHLHYCMNQFAGWDLWHNDKDNECSKCGMKENKGGCCKDEQKQIKIEDDHQKSTVAHSIQITATPAIITPYPSFTFNAIGLAQYIPASNAPPPIPQERLYVLNCVFLV